jgi:hypothetical protein
MTFPTKFLMNGWCNMEGELITYLTVWFGIRQPEWPEEDDEYDDKIVKNPPKNNIKIRKSIFRHVI